MSDNKKKNYRMIIVIMIFPFYLIFTIFFEIILGAAIGDKWDKLVTLVDEKIDKKI